MLKIENQSLEQKLIQAETAASDESALKGAVQTLEIEINGIKLHYET